MHGLIAQIVTVEGRRSELASILIGIGPMEGCLSYVVAEDSSREDALWVTELWESEEAHAASLQRPRARDAIERGMPLIVGFEQRIATVPVGGMGLGERAR